MAYILALLSCNNIDVIWLKDCKNLYLVWDVISCFIDALLQDFSTPPRYLTFNFFCNHFRSYLCDMDKNLLCTLTQLWTSTIEYYDYRLTNTFLPTWNFKTCLIHIKGDIRLLNLLITLKWRFRGKWTPHPTPQRFTKQHIFKHVV